MTVRALSLLAALSLLTGCALYNDVSISPLRLVPNAIDRGTDLPSMLKKGDYVRAIELASVVESRPRRSFVDLAALGAAELAAGRFDAARQHLRAAVDLEPPPEAYANICWNLAQVEYLSNNYEISLDWSRLAERNGLNVKDWHMAFVEALAPIAVYQFPAAHTETLPMRATRPEVPRVDVRVNDIRNVQAVIDSGAVLSIVSERFAAQVPVRSLGDFRGTFFGLLGEPISVRFGLVQSVRMGEMVVTNVPVAIMPDDKMRFVYAGQREFNIDFLLGANFLKEFRTELDFPKDRVTFTKLTALDRQPDATQNLFIHGFRPYVRGTINGRGWYLFVLDTGSEVTFLNEARLLAMPISASTPRMHGAKLQGLGGSQKHGTKLEGIEVGIDRWEGAFRTLPVYDGGQEASAGILGENFLKHFRVTLDFGKMRLDLDRY